MLQPPIKRLVSLLTLVLVAGCASQTVTRTVTYRAPAIPRPRTVPAARSFSGNGIKQIGTITIPAPATISWTCSGCATFTLVSSPSGSNVIAISSTRDSGTSAIDPGVYPDARVISDGDWTIRIRP